ncbi:unnamed protein product [Sphagnum jensenii]|uniref:Phage protein Gp138 N-terminal domain-containing protein n=1 Tax=Sphagnum jensenii TaxID=128206 RepID=A0ABP0V8A9_9BRYO
MPIAQGDQCLILFNDRSIDNWFTSGQVQPLASSRLHSFSDGIALVGLNYLNNGVTKLTNYDSTRAVLRNSTTGVGVSSTKANAAAAQAISSRLLSFLGDCFFDTSAGIDWFNFLGGSKSELALQLAINAVILNTQSQGINVVTGIINTSISLVDSTRVFSVSYTVSTIFGNVQNVVTQSLGIGQQLAPQVNNLLPQFNQVLLNNASATAITGAMFSSSSFWEIDLPYFIERRSASQTYTQRGTLVLKYDVDTSLWVVDNFVLSGNSGPTSGVTFSVNTSTGQVYYASDNMSSTGYVGNLIIQASTAFTAGF